MATYTMNLRSRSSASARAAEGNENEDPQKRTTAILKKSMSNAKGKGKSKAKNGISNQNSTAAGRLGQSQTNKPVHHVIPASQIHVVLDKINIIDDIPEVDDGDVDTISMEPGRKPAVSLLGPNTGLANRNLVAAGVPGAGIVDELDASGSGRNNGFGVNLPIFPNNGASCVSRNVNVNKFPGTPSLRLACPPPPPKKNKSSCCDLPGPGRDPPPPPGPARDSCLWCILYTLLTYLLITVPVIHYMYCAPPPGSGSGPPGAPGAPGQCVPCPGGDPGFLLPDNPGLKKFLDNYDADGTGLPDLALESIGGSIVSVRHTRVMDGGNFIAHAHNMDLMHVPNKPNTVIQIGNTPGTCWAFHGGNGSLVIRLARAAVISSFHLEHTSKKLAPSGNINSAPHKFQVYVSCVLKTMHCADKTFNF